MLKTVPWAWLAAGLSFMAAGCEDGRPAKVFSPQVSTQLEVRYSPVAIYPEAIAVRLKVHDLGYSEDGRPRFSRPEGRSLTDEQRSRFEAAFQQAEIIRRPPPGDGVATAAACFIPHHFFEYLDNAGRVVGEVAVCFCCDGARFSPSVGRWNADAYVHEDIAAIKTLVEDMGLPTEVGCD
jgi:hypothetical protein